MQYMRVYAPVDLDAIVFNLESMRKNIDRETGMLGVIKADAYGHGSVPVAAAIEDYVDGFAVATADEAMLLRRNGIQKMILILGVTHPSRYQELIESEIRPAIFTMAQAKPLSEAAVNMKKQQRSIWLWIPACAALVLRQMNPERILQLLSVRFPALRSRACSHIFPGPMRWRRRRL